MSATHRDPLPKFADYCEAACIKLWGEPNKRTARKLLWDGADDYGGRSFDLQKKTWYDHGRKCGGSTFELLDHERGQEPQKRRGKAFIEAWTEAHRMGLVPEAPPPKSGGKADGGRGRAFGEIRAVYPYHDEAGVLAYEVIRYDTEDKARRFRQRRPDGSGGWLWKTGTRQLLYRLPQLIEAVKAGQRVLITEGERDADTAARLGFEATTNSGGVNKWRDEYDEFFRGADVAIIADNDAPGQDHAANVARRLRKVAAHVRVVTPPGVKDLTAWCDAGGGPAALDALIASAPDLTSVPPEPEAPATGIDEAAEAAEIERLAKLSPLQYERERVEAAKRLGVRAGILDRLVAAERERLGLAGAGRDKQGRPIELSEPVPWPEKVEGPALLAEVTAAIRAYVVMNEHQRLAVALWSLHAHLIDRSMISPRLALRSALHGSGKTTCLEVLARLVPRALAAASVTTSAIFRVIAAHRPSLLIDEADTLFHEGDDLRRIINAGHRQNGAVLRSVGEDYEPRAFPCYAATVIALIGQLPPTVADRSIDIALTRRLPSEPITPFRLDDTASLDALARRIARWAKDNGGRLSRDPEMPPGLHNRASDNWRPLLAIAEALGGELPQKARDAASAMVGGDAEEVSRIELLLSDIRTIFEDGDGVIIDVNGNETITSAALIAKLVEIVPRPWAEYGRSGKPITANKLARLLKPLRIRSGLLGDTRLHGYRLTQFLDAFDRYLAPSPLSNRSGAQTQDNSSTYTTSQTAHPPYRDERFEMGLNPLNSKASEPVSGLKGGGPAKGPVCAHCGRPGGIACAFGDATVHLHRECQSAFLAAERSSPADGAPGR
jgi:hypothetical protein